MSHSYLTFLMLLACSIIAVAGEKDDPQDLYWIGQPNLFEWKHLDGNQINCTIATDGPYADFRETFNSGFEWPKGSGNTAIYAAGLWMVGIHRESDSLRTALLGYYQTEGQPGPLLETFNTQINDDTGPVARAQEPRYRAYKIDRLDTAAADYVEWPGDLGAPYVDVNRNDQWDQGVDRPEFYGDQQIWTVFNDVNNTRHSAIGATPPMGVEVHVLYWVHTTPFPLPNVMFIRWTIINKSDADYDSLYFGLWSDVDMGDGNDDLPGCDTTVACSYVYNGDDFDDTDHGYGSAPPAIGFTLLQGPVVAGTAEDSARLGGIWRHGFKNLGPTSMITPGKNTFAGFWDPPNGSPESAPIIYDYLRGMMGTAHQWLLREDSTVNLFWFSGDPVTGSGDLPENFPLGVFHPQDVRIMLNTGPCTLAQGDTQELISAVLISQGANRLESITALKSDVTWVRDFYYGGSVVDVRPDPSVSPREYVLNQNYPNPFNPTTTIRFALPHAAFATLKVYNILGEEVATLVNGQHDAGTHTATWDAAGLPSGVYFYSLATGDYAQSKKMLFVK